VVLLCVLCVEPSVRVKDNQFFLLRNRQKSGEIYIKMSFVICNILISLYFRVYSIIEL
jgi:hypothetical protein